jgi:uncharacterized protein GlcG (DUF336 family)
LIFVAGFSVQAADVVSQKNIGLDLATDLAMLSTKKCQEDVYQVSSVVVDKHGNVRVALRDELAARFTLGVDIFNTNERTHKQIYLVLFRMKSNQFRVVKFYCKENN